MSESDAPLDATDAALVALLESALLPKESSEAIHSQDGDHPVSSTQRDAYDERAAERSAERHRRRASNEAEWQVAMGTFRAICERTDRPAGAAPPRVAVSLALQIAAACRRWDAAMEILQLMQAHGLPPTCDTYKVRTQAHVHMKYISKTTALSHV